jgi:lambda family phage portal protein
MSKKSHLAKIPPAVVNQPAVKSASVGGAFDGASRTSQALATFHSPIMSPDREINAEKATLDSRGRDLARNDGFIAGALETYRDSIVGGEYKINSQPDWRALGLTEEWAEQYQTFVESRFTLWAESINNWPDAAGRNNFTGLIRLGLAQHFLAGEVLATCEWIPRRDRPYATAIQMIDPDRLSNPNGSADTRTLRRGVEMDFRGYPLAYWFQDSHPSESFMDMASMRWTRVKARKPWGRLQVIHIVEQVRPDQTRGLSAMVSVLKDMAMTKKFSDVVLQNAVANATFAATIESDLPRDMVFNQLGEGSAMAHIQEYLDGLTEYVGSAKNLHIDGVRIPHLFPGTKLNLKPAGQPGGVGTEFEASLLRHIAAALGLSYEQFSKDYTQTNYSSARASMVETGKYMNSRKKIIADRLASSIFNLWLEEEFSRGEIPLPPNAPNFWEGLNREAYSRCQWIGASRGQIDELKETQAAVLRINSGMSTLEIESGRLGLDWRVLLDQLSREQKLKKSLGIELATDPQKPGTLKSAGGAATQANKDDETDNDNEGEDE